MAFVARPHDLTRHEIMELTDKTVVHRFCSSAEKLPHPIEWLSDNGSQYTAGETRVYGDAWGFLVRNTPAYSPESNGMSEAFVGTFKRDYVYTHELPSAAEVLRQLPVWFEDSGLGYLSPREYRGLQKENGSIICDISDAKESGRSLVWGEFKKEGDRWHGANLSKG